MTEAEVRRIKRRIALERGVQSFQPRYRAKNRLKCRYKGEYDAPIAKYEERLELLRELQRESRTHPLLSE
jgi:hypothetical protein